MYKVSTLMSQLDTMPSFIERDISGQFEIGCNVTDKGKLLTKLILQLNLVRKSVMELRNNYTMSKDLYKLVDEYKNALDTYYYSLNQTYESYFLKEYGMSLQEYASLMMYIVSSYLGLGLGTRLIEDFMVLKNRAELQRGFGGTIALSLGLASLYKACIQINNPLYEFEMISE